MKLHEGLVIAKVMKTGNREFCFASTEDGTQIHVPFETYRGAFVGQGEYGLTKIEIQYDGNQESQINVLTTKPRKDDLIIVRTRPTSLGLTALRWLPLKEWEAAAEEANRQMEILDAADLAEQARQRELEAERLRIQAEETKQRHEKARLNPSTLEEAKHYGWVHRKTQGRQVIMALPDLEKEGRFLKSKTFTMPKRIQRFAALLVA